MSREPEAARPSRMSRAELEMERAAASELFEDILAAHPTVNHNTTEAAFDIIRAETSRELDEETNQEELLEASALGSRYYSSLLSVISASRQTGPEQQLDEAGQLLADAEEALPLEGAPAGAALCEADVADLVALAWEAEDAEELAFA
eukprot:tig00000237_g20462.t1